MEGASGSADEAGRADLWIRAPQLLNFQKLLFGRRRLFRAAPGGWPGRTGDPVRAAS